jgi:hypothetical protein
MSWDKIYEELEKALGRKPDAVEVQNRILEILKTQNEDQMYSKLKRR